MWGYRGLHCIMGSPLKAKVTGTNGVGVDMGMGSMDKGDGGRRIFRSPVWSDKGSMMGMMEGCRRATLEDPQGDMKGGFPGW